MTNKYVGSECPICHQPLQENDDIVVCPECGAPYHRACYQQEGHCVFPELHARGESYEVKQPEPEAPQRTGYATRCYRCGAIVDEGTLFCHHCGASLQDADQQQIPFPDQFGQNREQGNAFFGANMETIRMEDDLGDGYTPKEYSMAIRDNVPYYLLRFVRFSRGNSTFDFNFSAMLFGPIYFFYRRMIKWGLLYALALALLSVPSMIFFFRALITGEADLTTEMGLLLDVISFASYGLRFVAGMFANRLYYRHCKNRLAEYHRLLESGTTPNDIRISEWSARGGVNMRNVLLFACAEILAILVLFGLISAFSDVSVLQMLENYVNLTDV